MAVLGFQLQGQVQVFWLSFGVLRSRFRTSNLGLQIAGLLCWDFGQGVVGLLGSVLGVVMPMLRRAGRGFALEARSSLPEAMLPYSFSPPVLSFVIFDPASPSVLQQTLYNCFNC